MAYVLRSYPRLSQTFVVDEIRALERAGAVVWIFALVDPQEAITNSEVGKVAAPVHHLDAAHDPIAFARSLAQVSARTPAGVAASLAAAARDVSADRGYHVASRFGCWRAAVVLAGALWRREERTGTMVGHLHAHFAHDPALVARLASGLTGVPFSFTAHGRDVFQVRPGALARRMRSASAVVTCCRSNAAYLGALAPDAPINVVHNGLHLDEFERPPEAGPARGGDVPSVLCAARLVPKKGVGDLLRALAIVRRAGVRFRLRIVGDGPDRSALEGLVAQVALADVEFLGAKPRASVLAEMRRADVFALTPVIAADGDRDGIPTVLVEAMATGLPVVTTDVGGVAELVTDGHDGLVCRPGDVEAIAARLVQVIEDGSLRRRLGEHARRTVRAGFDARESAAELVRLFRPAGVREPLGVPTGRDRIRASLR